MQTVMTSEFILGPVGTLTFACDKGLDYVLGSHVTACSHFYYICFFLI